MGDINEADKASISDLEKGEIMDRSDEGDTVSSTQQREDSPTKEEQPTTNNHDNVNPQRTVTDWNGPNDPDNPHNWKLGVRIYHAFAPGLFGFAV
jgi:hypothetical protein